LFFLFCVSQRFSVSPVSLVEPSLCVISVSRSDQAIDSSSSGSDDDHQLPASIGLPQKTIATLACSGDERVANYDLLRLLDRDVVASNVLNAARFEMQVIDSHRASAFRGDCSTKSRIESLGVCKRCSG
jgi:hypothetical protein